MTGLEVKVFLEPAPSSYLTQKIDPPAAQPLMCENEFG